MNGLGDPPRMVIDCAGGEWTIGGRTGGVRAIAAPDDVTEFVAPAQATRRWAKWLTDALDGQPPTRTATVLAPSVFGAPRRGLVVAAAASVGLDATVVPRAHALVETSGLLYCRRAIVVESRGPVTQVHVLAQVRDSWRMVAAASHPDPGTAIRAVFDDRIDQAMVDAAPDLAATIAATLARLNLWRVVRIDAAEVIGALAAADSGGSDTKSALPGQRSAESDTEQTGGGPPRNRQPARFLGDLDEPGPRWPRRTVAVAAAAVGVVVVGVVLAVTMTRDTSAPVNADPAESPQRVAQVALADAIVELPTQWTISEPERNRRVAQAPDGRRITVVAVALRGSVDRASVAAELQSALAARSDGRITDLQVSGSVGDRDVISYRERVGDNRSVQWFVIVAQNVQLSIGCEAGDSAASVTAECENAVRSVIPR